MSTIKPKHDSAVCAELVRKVRITQEIIEDYQNEAPEESIAIISNTINLARLTPALADALEAAQHEVEVLSEILHAQDEIHCPSKSKERDSKCTLFDTCLDCARYFAEKRIQARRELEGEGVKEK